MQSWNLENLVEWIETIVISANLIYEFECFMITRKDYQQVTNRLMISQDQNR